VQGASESRDGVAGLALRGGGGMATPTPMAGEGTLAAVMPRSPSPTPADAGTTAAESPVLIFLYFHKAIRAELEGLHAAAVRLATERAGDVAALAERCRFFFSIYKHHCDAEDAVRLLAVSHRALFCFLSLLFWLGD
jgi:zinc finger protein-like protein